MKMVKLVPDNKKRLGNTRLDAQRLGIAQPLWKSLNFSFWWSHYGLDQDGIHEIHELFQKLKHGKTILLASHSASDISRTV